MWKEIKTWATSHGYKVDRTKVKDEENSYNYVWQHESASGLADSTFNLAKDIYNNISNNEHLNYQIQFTNNKSYDNIHSAQTY